MVLSKDYTTNFVTSTDGTKIGYRKFGAGPGVILVHGGLMSAQNFLKLAQFLAKDFTVFVPDRQGRGTSGTRINHGLAAETADIQALVAQTGAGNIFGLSSGAIITLQAAIATPSLKKIALYEPPIALNISKAQKWYDSYELAIVNDDFGKAFRSIFKCIEDNSWLTRLPAFIIVPLMRLLLKREAKQANGEEVTIRSLIAAFKYDYRIVIQSAGILNRCANIQADVLLLSGSKSAPYLKEGLVQLAGVLPSTTKKEFAGLDHTSTDNDGQPEVIVKELKAFFED